MSARWLISAHLSARPFPIAGRQQAESVWRDSPDAYRMATAAIVFAESSVGQKQHLVFEGVRAQWPAMAEDDGPTLPQSL
jgi:hypothetical protein